MKLHDEEHSGCRPSGSKASPQGDKGDVVLSEGKPLVIVHTALKHSVTGRDMPSLAQVVAERDRKVQRSLLRDHRYCRPLPHNMARSVGGFSTSGPAAVGEKAIYAKLFNG